MNRSMPEVDEFFGMSGDEVGIAADVAGIGPAAAYPALTDAAIAG